MINRLCTVGMLIILLGPLQQFGFSQTDPTAPQFGKPPPAEIQSSNLQAAPPPCCVAPVHHQVITDVVVLIDSTSSMAWQAGSQTRLSLAQWCALGVSDAVPDQLPAAFVKLEDSASTIRQLSPLVGFERSNLRVSVMQLRPVGGDNWQKGDGTLARLFEAAKHLLPPNENSVPLIVLITDGVDCDPHGAAVPLRDLRNRFGEHRLHVELLGICDHGDISSKLSDLAHQAGKHGHFSNIKSHHDLPSALTETRGLLGAVLKAHEAEDEWFRESLACCLKAKSECEAEIKDLVDRLKGCNEAQKILEAQNTRLQAEKTALHANLKCCLEAKAKVEAANSRLETQRLVLHEKLECCSEAKAKLESEKAKLELDSKELRERLKCCFEAKYKLETEIVKLELEKKELHRAVNELTAENARMTKENGKQHHEIQHLKSTNAKLEQQTSSLNIEIERNRYHSNFVDWWLLLLGAAVLILLCLLLCCWRGLGELGTTRSQLSQSVNDNARLMSEERRLQSDVSRLQAEVCGAKDVLAASRHNYCYPPVTQPAVVYGPVTTTPNGPVTTDSGHHTVTTPSGPVIVSGGGGSDPNKKDSASKEPPKGDLPKGDAQEVHNNTPGGTATFDRTGLAWKVSLDDAEVQNVNRGAAAVASMINDPRISAAIVGAAAMISTVNDIGGKRGVDITGVIGVAGVVVTPKGLFPLYQDLVKLGDDISHVAQHWGDVLNSVAANLGSTAQSIGGRIASSVRDFFGLGGGEDSDDPGGVIADRAEAKEWESFMLFVFENDTVAFLSWQGFFCAYSGGNDDLRANRGKADAWEKFKRIDNGDGTVSFKTSDNIHYWNAISGGNTGVDCRASAIGNDQKFKLEVGSKGQYHITKDFHDTTSGTTKKLYLSVQP